MAGLPQAGTDTASRRPATGHLLRSSPTKYVANSVKPELFLLGAQVSVLAMSTSIILYPFRPLWS